MLSLDEFTPYIPQLIELTRALVEIESPSKDKQAVDRVGQFVLERLQSLKARVEIVPQPETGDHIIARWSEDDSCAGILIIGHMDTVHQMGTLAHMPCVLKDDRLLGPGTMDMKSGIAVSLFTIGYMKKHGLAPSLPITALFTSDEEIGSLSSRSIIERLAQQSMLVLCLEPGLPDGGLKTFRKGVGMFTVTARGRAAHAGNDHSSGCNAIEELAYHVPTIQHLTDYDRGTTLNVGVIHGGTVSNVVPDEATLEVDLRVADLTEAERVIREIRSLKPVLKGSQLDVHGALNRPPMRRDNIMVATFKKAQRLGSEIGINLTEGSVGGGSDANFVSPLGVPVLDGLGPFGEGLHSEREYILISSLPQRAALLATLLTQW